MNKLKHIENVATIPPRETRLYTKPVSFVPRRLNSNPRLG